MVLVHDKPAKARPLFERALDICKRQLLEAVKGERECLEDLESSEVAEDFVRELQRKLLQADSSDC
jgi:hypothetical protein